MPKNFNHKDYEAFRPDNFNPPADNRNPDTRKNLRKKDLKILPIKDHGFPYMCKKCGAVFYRKRTTAEKPVGYYEYCSERKCVQARKRAANPPKDRYPVVQANHLYPDHMIVNRFVNRQTQTEIITLENVITGRKKHITAARYIMQEFLGEILLPKYLVRHRDGDPLNNALENLYVPHLQS